MATGVRHNTGILILVFVLFLSVYIYLVSLKEIRLRDYRICVGTKRV